MMDNPLVIVALATIPFFILGIVFLLIGLFRSRKAKKYARTSGVIIKGAKKKLLKLPFLSEKLIDTLYDKQIVTETNPTVSYKVDGKTYTSRSTLSQEPPLRIGKKVDVLYNPENPEEALIDTFIQRGSIFTLIGSIFLIILLIVWGVTTYLVVF